MDAPRGERPERLLESGATDFERRLLDAAAKDGPSREMSMRMASALGVSAAAVVATTTVAKANAAATAAQTAVAGGPAAGWPWIVGGVIGLSVVGALVVGGRWRASATDSRPGVHATPPALSPSVAPTALGKPARAVAPTAPGPGAFGPAGERTPAPAGSSRAPRAIAPGHDLHGEIELLDGARAAVTAKSGRRALELLRRYEDLYPTGSFLPEATAIRVEALVQLGRDDEARKLAERFVAEHRGSLLSDRVAAVAGLPRR